jgi:ATP-binding cassette subfamily B protein
MAVDWGEPELATEDRRAMIRRVLSYFRPYRRPGLLVVGCIAVQAALGLAPAVVFKSLIDTLARPHPSFAHVGLLVAAGIGAALLGGLVGVAQAYESTVISQGIVARLRRQLFTRLLDQPVGFFTHHKTGDLLSRINTDIDGVEDVVTDTVFGLVSNALVTMTTLALMLRFSWQLTLAVMVMIPLVALPARRAGRATYSARGMTQEQRGRMTAYLQEILGISGIMLVKAFGAERRERQRFAGMNDELQALEVRQNLIGQWFGMLMSTLQTAGPALMILFGGWLVVTGRASVGTVFVFATVLGQRLAGAVTSLAGMHVNITGSLALFGRLFSYIDRVPEITDDPAAIAAGHAEGRVRLDHVSFTYPGATTPAVDDLTVDIEPGQLVALVGRTACRAGRSSGWPSPGSSCATPGSSSWTRPRPAWTRSPSSTSRPRWARCCGAGPPSSSPTGCPPSWPPTRSSSWTAAGWQTRAPTPSCSLAVACTPSCTTASSAPSPNPARLPAPGRPMRPRSTRWPDRACHEQGREKLCR